MENNETKTLLGIMVGASLMLLLLFSPWENNHENMIAIKNVKSHNSPYKLAGFTLQQTNYMYNIIIQNSESFLFDLTNYQSMNVKNTRSRELVETGGYIVGIYNAK